MFIIVVVEVISIIFLATSRKNAIITECQLESMDKLSTVDYLTNSIYAALEVNAGCNKYWTNVILVYTIGFLTSLIVMVCLIYSILACTFGTFAMSN
jgi:hypothetical protein